MSHVTIQNKTSHNTSFYTKTHFQIIMKLSTLKSYKIQKNIPFSQLRYYMMILRYPKIICIIPYSTSANAFFLRSFHSVTWYNILGEFILKQKYFQNSKNVNQSYYEFRQEGLLPRVVQTAKYFIAKVSIHILFTFIYY